MTPEEQVEKVRQKVYDIVLAARTEGIVGGKTKWFARDDADDILSIPELWIEHPEQILPEVPEIYQSEDMLKIGYRRVMK